jgi:hypothetical protein
MSEFKHVGSSAREFNTVEDSKKPWHRPEVRVSSVPGATANNRGAGGPDLTVNCDS